MQFCVSATARLLLLLLLQLAWCQARGSIVSLAA